MSVGKHHQQQQQQQPGHQATLAQNLPSVPKKLLSILPRLCSHPLCPQQQGKGHLRWQALRDCPFFPNSQNSLFQAPSSNDQLPQKTKPSVTEKGTPLSQLSGTVTDLSPPTFCRVPNLKIKMACAHPQDVFITVLLLGFLH